MILLLAAAPAGCDDGPQELTGGSGGTTTGTTTLPTGGTGGTGGSDAGGSGGVGGTGGSGGTGGAPFCDPGTTMDCYSGPAGTAGVGVCIGGTRTCLADGSDYGPCEGEVVPAADDDCTTADDDDCDGIVNEAEAGCVCFPGDTMSCYTGPADTVGKGLCVGGQTTCAPDGLAWGPCEGQVLPAEETCATSGDDDCDGETNEGGPGCACAPGSVSPCYSGPPSTLGKGLCVGGMQMCNAEGTGFGACVGEVLPGTETCNTPVDDDCDGEINESGAGCVCPPNQMVSCYSGPMGTQNVGVCKSGLAQCNDQGTATGACAGEVLPGTETCNTAVDDDCDGQTNESGAGCVCLPGSTLPCYSGPMGTAGVGICKMGVQTCNALGTAYGACAGEVVPGVETCMSSGDEDCDGQSNEGCPVTYANDVQPIFAAKCGPCHTNFGSGGHNIGVSYADTQLNSYYCAGLTKGECALVRIQNGTMPTNGVVVTAQEQAIIQAWINGGMLP